MRVPLKKKDTSDTTIGILSKLSEGPKIIRGEKRRYEELRHLLSQGERGTDRIGPSLGISGDIRSRRGRDRILIGRSLGAWGTRDESDQEREAKRLEDR